MHFLYKDDNSSVIAGYAEDFNGRFRASNMDSQNYAPIAQVANLTVENMVRVHQNHTDGVLVVDEKNGGEGITCYGAEEDYDAMVTNTENLMLCINTADCAPVLLFDESTGVIGAAHSGRAGTMQDIAAKTVLKMKEEFGAKPENIRCILGPYLCAKHHEVQEKDIIGFSKYFTQLEQNEFLTQANGKYYVDMGTAIRISLMRTGVLGENINDGRVCTYEDTSLPSWRRDHNLNATMISFIVIKK